jgi:uncharacterized protein (TIGR03083 family)
MTHSSIEELSICWDSLAELLQGLSEDQWNTQSCCPDWTVKGVVAHLGGIEDILTGWHPASAEDVPPFGRVGPFIEAAVELPGSEVLEKFIDITDERRTDFAGMDDADFDKPSFTPVGAATYGRFMNVRVFDFWVHEQDIRHPLGLDGHESGPAAERSMDEVEGSLGYIFGKKVGLADGQSVTINASGGVSRTMHVSAIDGRAKQIPSLDNPSVVLNTDSTTFVMLACGRIDPQTEIDAGHISWTGDDELGHKAASNLRFTM